MAPVRGADKDQPRATPSRSRSARIVSVLSTDERRRWCSAATRSATPLFLALAGERAHHLPLHRQHQRLRDAGIALSRSTLVHWTSRAIDLLAPVTAAQSALVLNSRVLAMDEISLEAGRETKGKMRTGWLWPVYGTAMRWLVFHYAPSRAHRHVHAFLGTSAVRCSATDTRRTRGNAPGRLPSGRPAWPSHHPGSTRAGSIHPVCGAAQPSSRKPALVLGRAPAHPCSRPPCRVDCLMLWLGRLYRASVP